MCKAIDAAKTLINISIDRAKETGDDSYYLDIHKVHKLLYFAQKRMQEKYGNKMFEENIERHHCGPLIDELYDHYFGYGPIKQYFSKNSFFPLTPDRIIVLREVLEEHHKQSLGEMIYNSKNESDYYNYTIVPMYLQKRQGMS